MPVHLLRRLPPVLLLLPVLVRPAAAQDTPAAQDTSPSRQKPKTATAASGANPLGLAPTAEPLLPPSLAPVNRLSAGRQPLAGRQEKLLYAGGIALLAVTDQSTLRWFDSDSFRNEARAGRLPRESSDLASGLPLLLELAIPYLVDGRYGRQSAKLALGATLNALVVVQPLKMAFGKERPDQALGGTSFHGPSTRYDSFPSGHTAIAFAIATVYGERYRRWRIPIYLLATGVGLSRVDSGRHYLSDVFAGAGIGILAGRASLRGGGRLLSWRF